MILVESKHLMSFKFSFYIYINIYIYIYICIYIIYICFILYICIYTNIYIIPIYVLHSNHRCNSGTQISAVTWRTVHEHTYCRFDQ